MSELPHDGVERDVKLTAIYRAAGQDAPPAELDDAIRAAARRAVGARPRPAGFAFGHSWRVPLSIAAVLVLSVSLVTLLQEEAPELAESPRAEPPIYEVGRKPAAGAESGATTNSHGFVRDEERSRNIGLKAPQPMPSAGLGMRPGSPEQRGQPGKEMTDRLEADAVVPPDRAKRRDAPASPVEQRGGGSVPGEPSRQAAQINAPPDSRAQAPASLAAASGVLENKTQAGSEAVRTDREERQSPVRAAPAPAPVLGKSVLEAPRAPIVDARSAGRAKAAPQAVDETGKLESYAQLTPEKWLERIELLRKEGKLDEAKASLTEFRKRFPDYRLPDALRDWDRP